MMNTNVFFTVFLCVLFAGCKKEEPLVATDPTSKIINIDGHDFVIRGDIDGEEFVIKHESNVQLNSPENNEMSFGTYFRLEYPGKLPEKDISLGITKNGDSMRESQAL